MNFLGLNSPVIFIISAIVLIILGPKRIEKGWFLFQRLLKFLLSDADNISRDKSNVESSIDLNSEKSEVSEVKEEVKDVKVKKSEVSEVKEEVKEAIVQKLKESEVKEEVKDVKVKKSEVSEVKEEIKKTKVDKSEIGVLKEEVLNSQLKEKNPRTKTKRQNK